MAGHGSQRRRGQGDAGVTLILFALAMVGILLIVALVIDYGNVRNSRQDNKLTADVVATAGLQSLAPDGIARPWRAVCSALGYLKVNKPDLTLTVSYLDGNGTALSGNPCSSLANQECVANIKTTWAWIHAVGGAQAFDIMSGYVTPDPAFPEDATTYSGDNGTLASGGCDQLAVIVSKADDAFFGGIGGRSGYDTASRSVGRVRIGLEGDGVPAFLMLERKSCDALSEQVGSGEAGIIVESASPDEPGIIHVDSSGSPAAGCNGNNNPSGWAVYSSGTGGPKIVAKPAADGTPGIISIHALEIGPPPAAYAGSTAAGLSPAPTSGKVVSRKPVDEKYNPASAPTISNLHAAAYTDANRSTAPAGYLTVTACNNSSTAVTAPLVFVNCPSGYSPGNVTFPNATDVIFNGPVSVSNNKQLYLPAARRIVVGGIDSGPNSGGLSVAGGGRLGINSVAPFADTDAGVLAACTGREGTDGWTQTTQLIVFGGRGTGADQGALNVTGRGALCQTFAYLAGPKTNPTYTRREITNGSYDPTCLAAKPCASASSTAQTNAFLYVVGTMRWSAPNQLSVQPPPGSVGVEDLALWTESAMKSEVKSGGDLQARGVYFLPNARFEMRSPATATPQDAQFIARSLQLLQGALRMQPTPGNAVQIPVLQGIGVVR